MSRCQGQSRPGESAFACALVALENEDGFANLAGVLEGVSEPTHDVATGLTIACTKYTVDVVTHQLPTTALAWEYSKPTPEVEAVVGKDFGFVWFRFSYCRRSIVIRNNRSMCGSGVR
jgi:hypothetical protein